MRSALEFIGFRGCHTTPGPRHLYGGDMPNRIIRDSIKTSTSLAAVSDLAERTFFRLITLMDDFGRYHGSPKTLLAACFPEGAEGLTRVRFDHALTELEEQDMVRFYSEGSRRYCYSPTWPKYQRRRASESKFPQPPEYKGRGHLTADDSHVRTSAAVVEDVVGVVDDINPCASSEARGCVGFDQFWEDYPKKKARGDALKAWKQTSKSRPAINVVLAAVARQKDSREWMRRDGQFIPYPATWLRAGQWDDVVEVDPGEEEIVVP